MNGKHYMYIVYCPTNLHNKGRIVRFNIKKLDAMGIQLHPQQLKNAYHKHHGKYSKTQKQIHKYIKVGPIFTTGHGQSLAYNWKNHGLYMWRDKERLPEFLLATGDTSSTSRHRRCGRTTPFVSDSTATAYPFRVVMISPSIIPEMPISGRFLVGVLISLRGKFTINQFISG